MEQAVWVGVGLIALRWWALLSMQVVWREVVGPWWTVVAAILAVALGAGTTVTGFEGLPLGTDLWTAAVAEIILGGCLGAVVALPGHALVGGASMTAGVLGTAPGSWRALTLSLVAASGLRLGFHRPLIRAGNAVMEAWPLGQPGAWNLAELQIPVAQLGHAMTLLALTLATPALLSASVVAVVVGIWGTGPPVIRPCGSGLVAWLKSAAALIATGASWAVYEAVWAQRVLVQGVVER